MTRLLPLSLPALKLAAHSAYSCALSDQSLRQTKKPRVDLRATLAIVFDMKGAFADGLFRITFLVAGAYNLAFGLWAAARPLAFFAWFDLDPPRYPGIWACLGMVVGVYGLLYWHAAWRLATAWPIIGVGLLGKVLGPIGMVMSFGDDWPRRLGMLCIYNDLIWWLPFGLFLIRGTRMAQWLSALAPWLCAGGHAAAFFAIPYVLRPGMLTQPDIMLRAQHISQNVWPWTIGWSFWMLAAATLVGFYAWWGSWLSKGKERYANRRSWAATIAVVIAAVGMTCDFSGEGLAILVLVERAEMAGVNAVPFTTAERSFTILCAGLANGLYTIGGMILMFATPGLPRWIRAAMWGTWIAGIVMTISGLMNHVSGMMVATGVLFPLLIAWVIWMGARWREA